MTREEIRLPLLPVSNPAPSYGLEALERELLEQGVDTRAWLETSGLDPRDGLRGAAAPTHRQRVALLRNAERLALRPDTALRAGGRQRISDFGLYGFALATSRTFADAFAFGREHLQLAGPVLRISFELRGDVGVLRSHDPAALGAALPFVAEFWRSSMTTLLGHVLGAPFPSRAMFFPYEAPRHAAAYRAVFRCPVHFGSDVMEWHFDASVMERPCPNASDVTARVCQDFCDRIVAGGEGGSLLEREVRRHCLARQGYDPAASEVAAALGLSLRTFYRRLADEGLRFQQLLDATRRSVAVEYLENTRMPVDEIGRRLGFADASNFRKAFRRWTGRAPSAFRARGALRMEDGTHGSGEASRLASRRRN